MANFPASPSNGDLFTNDLGVVYMYVSTGNYWKIVSGALANVLNSPALTGTPTAPTAALSTQTTQIATTAFVLQNLFYIFDRYIYFPTTLPIWDQLGYNGLCTYSNESATNHDGIANKATTLNLTTTSWDIMLRFTNKFTAGVGYTLRFWVKLGTATNFAVSPNDTIAWNTITGHTYTTAEISSATWTQITFTWTQPAARTNVNLHMGAHSNSGNAQQTAGSVYISDIEIYRT